VCESLSLCVATYVLCHQCRQLTEVRAAAYHSKACVKAALRCYRNCAPSRAAADTTELPMVMGGSGSNTRCIHMVLALCRCHTLRAGAQVYGLLPSLQTPLQPNDHMLNCIACAYANNKQPGEALKVCSGGTWMQTFMQVCSGASIAR
jgi:hypothetical protein